MAPGAPAATSFVAKAWQAFSVPSTFTAITRIVEGEVPIREDVGAQPSASEEVVSTAFGGDWEFRGVRAPKKG